MGPYVIGIDLGTGSVKALAVDQAGEIIDTQHVACAVVSPRPGYQEQEPELIWQAFVKCISGVTSALAQSPAAICLSSAMHSMIPVDKAGKPLMNAVIWADNRSGSVARKLRESSAAEMLYEQTGTPIHAMSPLTKIKWLAENQPDLFKITARFISLKEYVWFRLSRHYEVDYSIASATGLFDTEKLVWNVNALDIASVQECQLSRPVNADHQRTCTDPSLCRQLGIEPGTPFYIGASDGCLANIGSFATEEGVMALTIGTSGAVRVMRKSPIINFGTMTFNYRLDDSAYICGGPTNNGGLVLKWYAENVLGKPLESADDYIAFFKTMAETPPGAEGLLFLPYIMGERGTIWNSDACGVFFGMRHDHRRAHFNRAVIEGISMALYDIAYHMIENGLSLKRIHASGGFVHSPEWLQVLADMFGKPIHLINTADASSLGAAFLALKNLSLIGHYDEMKPEAMEEFNPRRECTSTYRASFRRYRALYEKAAPFMAFENT